MRKSDFKSNCGFTVIETLIYIALTIVVVGNFTVFASLVSSSRAKISATQEINRSARFIIDIITRNVKAADNIVSPIKGTSSNELELFFDGGVSDFGVMDGALFLSGEQITGNKVNLENIFFKNIDDENIEFGFKFNMGDVDSVEFQYEKEYKSIVNLRK